MKALVENRNRAVGKASRYVGSCVHASENDGSPSTNNNTKCFQKHVLTDYVCASVAEDQIISPSSERRRPSTFSGSWIVTNS